MCLRDEGGDYRKVCGCLNLVGNEWGIGWVYLLECCRWHGFR